MVDSITCALFLMTETPNIVFFLLFFTSLTVTSTEARSAATCAAALELPNLNYAHGQNYYITSELKLKDK